MKDVMFGIGCLFVAILIVFIPMLFGYALANDDGATSVLGSATLIEIGIIVYLLFSYI